VPAPLADPGQGERPALRLEGRTALVTGGGSGIGRAICEVFAAEGAAVIPVDVRGERARETAQLVGDAGGRATPLTADVSDEESVDSMAAAALESHERIDILVNNAAVCEGDDILEFDGDVWDLNLRVDLKSVYLCSRALLPRMLDRGRGAIVNVSSVNGLTGLGEEAYSAAKAGMISLTCNMAIRYGDRGVRVNALCPGTIVTPIWMEQQEKDPGLFERLVKWYPIPRLGTPEDVARAALFFASDDAAWVTGQTLCVDGGLMAGLYGMARELTVKDPDQTGG